MKTRNDYVSNSSSCSFVVALPNEDQYKFKDFVKGIVRDCAKCKDKDYEMSKEQIAELKAFNARNLEYHLNSSELLFLGTVQLDNRTFTAVKPSRVKDVNDANAVEDYNYELERWNELKKDIESNDFGKGTGEKVVKATSKEIVISYPEYASGIAVPSMQMTSLTGHYSFVSKDKEKPEDRTHAAEQILKLLNTIKDPKLECSMYHFINTSMYYISLETIWNTRAMLENNVKIEFEDWENLDKLEKRLKKGERLYVIRQNNGGDGWDNDAIYGLGGWEAVFGESAQVEILYSEVG